MNAMPSNLATLLEYRDGWLYWKVRPNVRIRLGSRAGRLADGRYIVRYNGVDYKGHRLIWALHFGDPGELQIDHKDRDTANNLIENLRPATGSQNQENRDCRGTHFCNTRKRWLAKIKVRGKQRTIGQFATESEANAAYLSTKRAEHEFCTI